MSTTPKPTAQLEPYVSALGTDLAITFLIAFGGAELYIPANPKGRSRIVEVIGRDGAEALATISDRLPRRVPLGKPWIAKVWYAKGLPKAEIARRLHTSDVSVRRWLAGQDGPDPKHDPRQMRLF
ncbi:hypothetical protein RHVG_00025 [Rhodovulum phage RS1]|uniref:late transcriptional activator n=1 Tax=Rhodobacter phage RC1 TaxID=754055 RepID=UPI0002C180B0|nr:late transcriptional activator [Rhodobacter phage RC1]YP_007676404.1 late transcriptional activator [Rhodovulum phage RS1]AGH57990.1 hypothetical protein RHVG_00025 [Rhodovulum phage RS1]AGH58052.1 hypothetical protein RHWG_00031 [Rhodobacter phage RC1]